MFAELGNIRFQVVGSPEAIESERKYAYAMQEVIEAQPRLQWTGGGLERIEFDIMFHASITDPAAQLMALRVAADAHEPMALVFGNGVFRGYYVIESIRTRSAQLTAGGSPFAIEARIGLLEWALDSALNSSASPIPASAPLGIVSNIGSEAGTASAISPDGVTPLLSDPVPSAPATAAIQASDIPTAVITRSAAL